MRLGIITCIAFALHSFLFAPPKSQQSQQGSSKQVKKDKKDKDDDLLDEILNNPDREKILKQAKTPESKHERELKLLQKAGRNVSFLLAVKEGNIDLCRSLLASGADCNFTNEKNNTALLYVVAKYSDEKVNEFVDLLLAHGANPNHLNKRKYGPLLIATERGNEQIVEKLIAHGANVNEQSCDGITPLLYATSNNHMNIIPKLLQAGAKDIQDANGFSPLMIAITTKNIAAFEMFIDAKFDLNFEAVGGATPLLSAIHAGSEDLVKALIAHGVDCNYENKNGQNPLFQAAYKGYEKIVELLIDAGVNPNRKNKHSDTALMWAIATEERSVIQSLLARGIDPTIKNSQGLNALRCSRLCSPEIYQLVSKLSAESLETKNNKKTMHSFYKFLHDYPSYKRQAHEQAQLKKRIAAENLEPKNNAVLLRSFYEKLRNYPNRSLANPYEISAWADCWDDEVDVQNFESIRKKNSKQ